MNQNNYYTESTLVKWWTNTLKFLEKISLFYLVRTFIIKDANNEKKRLFVDMWLIAHTLLPIIFVAINYIDNVNIIVKYCFVAYGSLRIFEILIYQLNVMLVHPYETRNFMLNGYRRMTIALIHNFFEIVFWFAGTYLTFHFINDITPMDAVYHSFTHMVTYSLSIDSNKWSIFTLVVIQSQALMGVFMTLISLARFISLFPQPKSMDEKENQEDSSKELADIKKELEEIKKLLREKIVLYKSEDV
ncbi:hypothetical protein MHB42_03445 [Lysinibacillus sp. FSL K6-0232]|uniref:hypothetical protein n=1 Tax=Lysinibacillus sp. FSL K6-0232 TaxID=2921425 RepID=UPI0030FBA64A